MDSKNPNKVHISGRVVKIPLEAYHFIGERKMIAFREKTPNHFSIAKGYLFNVIGRRICAVLIGTDDCFAKYFILNRSRRFKPDTYHIVNYKSLYLLPDDGEGDNANVSRQKSWKDIKEYHEHLRIQNQGASAVQCSKWLATLFNSHQIETVLEVGCGSGRNLHFIKSENPQIGVFGIDINETAVKIAKEQVADSENINVKSIYDLDDFADDSMDIVFTSGVLMHVPQDKIEYVIRQMHRISKKYVYHFELHGPEHHFDYHRYPRDYMSLYRRLNLNTELTYEVYPQGDFRTTGPAYEHALLSSLKSDKNRM